ncbi:SitA5 family polymorphic toxin [Hyalangium gracile]|uniref:SitA5 family polymorphic toxin n=1 Tax=Hyalangium gracile TaxID=394092 RepID=UPI001CCC1F41|nr:hypothetical protein [Hyalangium gracile]
MKPRQLGALLLAWLTACAGTPRGWAGSADRYEAELTAARYELRVLTSEQGQTSPMEVRRESFQQAMRWLIQGMPPFDDAMETSRWLVEGSLQADLLAEVERGRVVRLTPMEDDSPLEVASAAEVKRKYLALCQQEYGGGDCLGLLADGNLLTRNDLRSLGLALSLRQVLRETRVALKEMMSPRALLGMIVWTGCFYLLLWLLPEPVSKAVAASLTLALLAWLPVHSVWSLMDGWGLMVHEVDRATSYEQIEEASGRFSRTMGENTARVLVMLVTAVLAGSTAQFVAKLPKLPGFERAAAWAEAQGLKLAGEVEAVAVAEEGSFTFMVRHPGGRAAVGAAETARMRMGITTVIRHQGGNRQVFFNGQRWHVPAKRSIGEIPAKDPVGDQLQVAAQRVAREWSRGKLTDRQVDAINEARAQGKHLEAHLMERRFRGQWVENMLRAEFRDLRWNRTGVDADDAATGLRYEVLSGTDSNMERHGRRMAEEFFRLITF